MFFGGDPFEHFGHHGGGGRARRGPAEDVDTTKLYETLGVSGALFPTCFMVQPCLLRTVVCLSVVFRRIATEFLVERWAESLAGIFNAFQKMMAEREWHELSIHVLWWMPEISNRVGLGHLPFEGLLLEQG